MKVTMVCKNLLLSLTLLTIYQMNFLYAAECKEDLFEDFDESKFVSLNTDFKKTYPDVASACELFLD